MKAIITAVLALALASTVACGEQWRGIDVEDVMANAPDTDEYPDASALFLKIQEIIEIAEDGSSTEYRNRLTKILTLMGRENYSNQISTYNTDRTELSLVKGQTVRKSGRVVEVEEDGVNDITPAFLEGATIYANVLQKVISFPVAGPGSTMESQLLAHTSPAKDGAFSGIEYMGGRDPTLSHEISLVYPSSVEFATHVSTGMIGPAELPTSSGPGEITWSVEDLPAVVPEENMPGDVELLPRILYSSYGSWDQAAAFFAGEFLPHVEVDGEIATRVQEITAGLPDDEKLRALFLDVTTNIRNVYLNLGLGGYEPNDAGLVLSNRYGDTRDKAVLLISMLRAAGLSAFPALVRGLPGPFVETVPTLRQFDRILIAIPETAGYRFLDPFLDDVTYGYLRWGRGNTALVVRDDGSGELVYIPPFDPHENLARVACTVTLADDGSAEITTGCELHGYFDRKARRALKDATPTEEQKTFDAAANAVSAGALDAGHASSDLKDLTEPALVEQAIDAPDFAVAQGNMMIVRMPRLPFGFASIGVYPSLAERKYPFDFPCEFTSEFVTTLEIPAGFEVVRMPEGLSVSGDVADLALTCDWDEVARKLTWRQTFSLRNRRVPTESYVPFKEDHNTLASPKSRLVLLRRTA